jgi:integral membrane sensor domain MASE1
LGSGLLPTCSWPFCLSGFYLLIVPSKISCLSLPLLWCTFSFPAPSAVLLDYSSLFVIQVFFWGGSVCPEAVLIYPGRGWGNSMWHMVLPCLGCRMSPRQD